MAYTAWHQQGPKTRVKLTPPAGMVLAEPIPEPPKPDPLPVPVPTVIPVIRQPLHPIIVRFVFSVLELPLI